MTAGESAASPQSVRGPVRQVAFWLGIYFVVNGIGAFVYNAQFTVGTGLSNVHGWAPLTLHINAWHALFHLVPGLLGLAASRSAAASRRWAWSMGALYVIAGVWGLIVGNSALVVISVERFGSWVHLVEATAILGGGYLAVRGADRRRVEVVTVAVLFAALVVTSIMVGFDQGVGNMCCCGSC